MYKVYINSLLKELSDHCFAISINTLRMQAPSFADDICLIALHQSLLKILMNKCHNYSKKWRYEFNHSKSGVVTFGETKPIHCKSMKEREWALGGDTVEELYEYKNLGVLKITVAHLPPMFLIILTKRAKCRYDFLIQC